MVPAITPPTDNLYKFVSLFGLTILLFSLYNLSQIYDAVAANKVAIEEVKRDLRVELLKKEHEHKDLAAASGKTQFKATRLEAIGFELEKLTEVVRKSPLADEDKIYYEAEVGKLHVNHDYLQSKVFSGYLLTAFGAALMIFGFFRWNKREQRLRDELLRIEIELKKYEKDKRGN